MNVGVDLDNTLINLDIINALIERHNYPCSIEEYIDWNMDNFPKHIQSAAFKLFKDETFMCNNVKPIKGSQETIELWSKKHNIILITARSEHLYDKTKQLVNDLFPHITDFNSVGFNQSKKDLFIEKKLDAWIDDAPHGIIDAIECGIKTYLISNETTRYNWHIKSLPNVNHVESIDKINL